ncbi:MAG: hypothetical protein IJI14_17700 [Anaerolineaceae bacterium]|nr:hypothetical protein [Anaerolineaceae bacterium]
MATTLGDILDYINKHTEVQARLYTGHTKLYPYIEFRFFSGLGRDCLVTLWLENESVDAFFEAITNHCQEYPNRCEEDLESYIRERPDGTEDFSVRELVDDSDWKVKFWTDFVNDLKSKFADADQKAEEKKNWIVSVYRSEGGCVNIQRVTADKSKIKQYLENLVSNDKAKDCEFWDRQTTIEEDPKTKSIDTCSFFRDYYIIYAAIPEPEAIEL